MALSAAAAAMAYRRARSIRLTQNQKMGIGLGLAAGAAVGAVLLLPKVTAGPPVATITFASDRSSGPVPFSPVLRGTALDANGNPVARASLALMVNGKTVSSVTSDSSGAYSLQPKFPDAGNYACSMKSGNVSSAVLMLTATSTGIIFHGYEIGLSRTDLQQIIGYGYPTIDAALTAAKNYQENSQPNPPTLYIFNADQNNAFVQAVTWTPPGGSYLLEIFDVNGAMVYKQTYSSVASAMTYINAHYTIVPPPGVGAIGTYDIFDSQSAIVQYGYIA